MALVQGLTHTKPMERDDPHADLGGGIGSGYVPPPPVPQIPRGFAEECERILVTWYRSGAQLHPRDVTDSIIQLFRSAGWREPPVGKSPMAEEWRRRSNYRLPPERVQANAAAVREQLHASKRADVGPVDSVGGNSGGGAEA